MPTPLRWLLRCLALIWLAILAVPSLWLLVSASTLRGTLIAITGFIAAIWPWLLIASAGREETTRRIQIGGGALLLLGLALIVITSPSGTPGPDSPVSNRYVGAARYQRLAIPNLVPEIEQLQVGFTLIPYADPLIDRQEAAHVRAMTGEIYRAVDADPHFRALGSALGYGYVDVLGGRPAAGHYYLYIPRSRPAGPLPALVFLHGAAGNFKAYIWLLSRVAEERGLVVIAPTFGFGNWRAPGGLDTIYQTLDAARSITDIDPHRVYLAGLSNGGLGVSLAAADQPDRFAGLIFLSPVFATEATDSPAFLGAWRSRPVLIITGAADDRIPITYVDTRASILQSAGVDVTYQTYPGENHFLVFSRHDEVLADLSDWLGQQD